LLNLGGILPASLKKLFISLIDGVTGVSVFRCRMELMAFFGRVTYVVRTGRVGLPL